MPDLLLYIPNHGYSISDTIFVSWLNTNFYVRDPDNDPAIGADSFKISTDDSDDNLVQFSETITNGFVREVDVSAGTTTISGLGHLEGETVIVTSAGSIAGVETVSGGEVTIGNDVFTYQVGLLYKMKVRTMRLSIPQEGATVQSRIKKITRTVVRFIRSLGGQAGQEYAGVEHLQNMEATFSAESQDTPPNNRLAQGGFSEDAYTTIISNDPVPFTVLATIVDVEIEK